MRITYQVSRMHCPLIRSWYAVSIHMVYMVSMYHHILPAWSECFMHPSASHNHVYSFSVHIIMLIHSVSHISKCHWYNNHQPNHQPKHISLTVATRPTEQFTVKWYCEHSPTQSRISSPLVGMWAINITSAGQSCLSATDTITINQTINQSISAWLSRPRPTEQFTVRWYCEHSPIQSRISSPLVGMWTINHRLNRTVALECHWYHNHQSKHISLTVATASHWAIHRQVILRT